MFLWLLSGGLVAFVVWVAFRYSRGRVVVLREDGSVVPEAEGSLPLLGHLLKMGDFNVLFEFLLAQAAQHPDWKCFTIHGLDETQLIVVDPELAEELARERPFVYHRYSDISASVFRSLGGRATFSTEDEEWKAHRAVAARSVTPTTVRRFHRGGMQSIFASAVQRWDALAATGTPLVTLDETQRIALEVIFSFAFRYDASHAEAAGIPWDTAVSTARAVFRVLEARTLQPTRLWQHPVLWRLVPSEHAARRTTTEFRKLAQQLMALVPKNEGAGADASNHDDDHDHDDEDGGTAARSHASTYLDILRSSAVPEENRVSEALAMILAGSDTTAALMGWVFVYLALHPDVQERLRVEVDRMLPASVRDGTLAETQAADLLALDECGAFIQELLRLRAPAQGLLHQPARDVTTKTAGGLKLRKGLPLFVAFRPMDYRNVVELDTRAGLKGVTGTEFDIDRWLDPARKPIQYTFGAGPRGCPGRALADLEIRCLLVQVLSRYTVRTVPGAKPGVYPAEKIEFSMRPEDAAQVVLEPRAAH